mgnify:CR=1 FL=1
MLKKYSLFLSLLLSLNAQAMPHRVSIIEQCENLELTPPTFISDKSIAFNMVRFERSSLALQNIKDVISYHLKFVQGAEREPFLACQMKIAQKQSHFLEALEQGTWLEKMRHSNQTQITSYLESLDRMMSQQPTLDEYSKLIATSSSYKSIIHNPDQHILISKACRLPGVPTKQRFSIKEISFYLHNQNNETCRKQVWFVYQERIHKMIAKLKSQTFEIQKKLANKFHFNTPFSYQIRNHYLNKTQWVEFFLEHYPAKSDLKPWNVIHFLSEKHLEKDGDLKFKTTNTSNWLQDVMKQLGLKVDVLSENQWRIWHDKRLLGELFIFDSPKIRGVNLKKTVVGMQYGISHLFMPKEISQPRHKKALIQALGLSIYHLAHEQNYYLLTEHLTPSDLSHVGIYWMMEKFASYQGIWKKIERSNDLLKLWRSQYAFDFYQGFATEKVFDFRSLLDDGTYYQKLWQKQLARYLVKQVCIDDGVMFSMLFEKDPTQFINKIRHNEPMPDFIKRVLSPKQLCWKKSTF